MCYDFLNLLQTDVHPQTSFTLLPEYLLNTQEIDDTTLVKLFRLILPRSLYSFRRRCIMSMFSNLNQVVLNEILVNLQEGNINVCRNYGFSKTRIARN